MKEIYIAILWPPSVKYSSKIESDIASHYKVVKSTGYKFGDREFKRFMYKTYKPDKTPEQRIRKKYNAMRKHGRTIRIIEMEIPNPTMSPHKKRRLRGTFYCREMKTLKRIIREKYKRKIKGYVYDIIIHGSDNQDHNNRTRNLLDRLAREIK